MERELTIERTRAGLDWKSPDNLVVKGDANAR
jgi:hypothetical protein